MKKSIVYALVCIGILCLVNNASADAPSDELKALQKRWDLLNAKKKFLSEMVTNFISQDWNDISQGKNQVSNASYVPLNSFFNDYNSLGNDCSDFHNKYREFSNGSPAFYNLVNQVIIFNNTTLFEVEQQLKTAASGQLFKKTAIAGENGAKISYLIDQWLDTIGSQKGIWNKIALTIKSPR